jgi:hypothetical protein
MHQVSDPDLCPLLKPQLKLHMQELSSSVQRIPCNGNFADRIYEFIISLSATGRLFVAGTQG